MSKVRESLIDKILRERKEPRPKTDKKPKKKPEEFEKDKGR